MALSVTNNMTAYGTGDTGEAIDVATGAGWYDLDNLHADFGRLTLQSSITADYYQGASGTEGCKGISHSTSATTVGYVYYDGSSTIDMSGTMYIRCTAKFGETSKMGTKAQGGIQIIVVDSSGNYRTWFVGGSDDYSGDWEQFLIDVSVPFDSESATAPTMSSIQYIGICSYYVTKPARAENIYLDAQWYGSDPSITVTGTVTTVGDGLSELESLAQSVANRYGVIRLRNGVYELRGGIKVGDASGTGNTDFSDYTNAKMFFQPAPAGTLDCYAITIQGNATGTTNFQLGDVLGTGDDRQGLLGGIISTLGDRYTFDAETDTADIDSCELYGVAFEGAGNIKLSGSTTQEAIGCSFLQCDEVQPNDAEFLNNKIIAPSPDRGLEYTTNGVGKQIDFIAGSTADQPAAQVWQVDESATPDAMVDYTDEFNESTANDVICFPATEAANDLFLIGFPSKFAGLTLNVGTARSGGSLTWVYRSASAWSSLTTTDGTNTLSTTGSNDVTFTPPTDWTAYTPNLEDSATGDNRPMFYVGLQVSTVMTTNPLITQGWITDVTEHLIHYPDATKVNGYSATDLQFFGAGAAGAPKWHGENSETRNTVTAGSFVTNQWYEILTVGTTDFTLIGAASNTIGVHFKATGPGTGTGTAFDVLALNSEGSTNIAANEFDNTGATAGDVEVVSSVTITITVLNEDTDAAINLAHVQLYLTSDYTTEVLSGATNASGIITGSYGGTTPAAVEGWAREWDVAGTDYEPTDISGTITSSGFTQTVKLKPVNY